MQQKRIANILKIFSIAVAVVGALFFFWYVPVIIQECAIMMPEAAYLRWPGTIGVWVIALLCYIALWEFWRICTRIGNDNSFCMENARSMKHIGLLAFLAALLIVGAEIFLISIHCFGGTELIATFFLVFAACGIGVVCLALSRLIRNAAELKEENDLTI